MKQDSNCTRPIKIRVSIADYKIARGNNLLISYGLGSCIGIAIFQEDLSLAGLAHVLLPEREKGPSKNNPLKYADYALKVMYEDLISHGAEPKALHSKIAGGAHMFYNAAIGSKGKTVGQRNLEAVVKILDQLEIPIIAQDTGGNHGRTIQFNPQNACLTVKSLRMGVQEI